MRIRWEFGGYGMGRRNKPPLNNKKATIMSQDEPGYQESENTNEGQGSQVQKTSRVFRLGLLQGKEGWIADDFDGPLPDELLAQFEGRDDADGL